MTLTPTITVGRDRKTWTRYAPFSRSTGPTQDLTWQEKLPLHSLLPPSSSDHVTPPTLPCSSIEPLRCVTLLHPPTHETLSLSFCFKNKQTSNCENLFFHLALVEKLKRDCGKFEKQFVESETVLVSHERHGISRCHPFHPKLYLFFGVFFSVSLMVKEMHLTHFPLKYREKMTVGWG